MSDYPKMVELEMQIDSHIVLVDYDGARLPKSVEAIPLGTLPTPVQEELGRVLVRCLNAEFDGKPDYDDGHITVRLRRQAEDEDDLDPEQMLSFCDAVGLPFSLWRSDHDEFQFWIPGIMQDPHWLPVKVKPDITIDKLRALILEHHDIQAAIDAILATQPRLS